MATSPTQIMYPVRVGLRCRAVEIEATACVLCFLMEVQRYCVKIKICDKSMFVQGWEHPELASFPGRLGPGNEDNLGWDAHGSILGLGMGWK